MAAAPGIDAAGDEHPALATLLYRLPRATGSALWVGTAADRDGGAAEAAESEWLLILCILACTTSDDLLTIVRWWDILAPAPLWGTPIYRQEAYCDDDKTRSYSPNPVLV